MFEQIERKWGNYRVLLRCKRICIKILTFKKHGHLSEQRHFHRNEIWIYLSGALFLLKSFGKINDQFTTDCKEFLTGIKPPKTEEIVMAKAKGRRIKKIALIKNREWHRCFAYDESKILEVQFGNDVRESDIERL